MGAIFTSHQADARHPFIDKTGILPGAEMATSVNPAGKDIFLHCATAAFKPSQETGPSIGQQFELNRPTCFLLHHDRARSDLSAADNIANFYSHEIAAPKFAIDREVEQSPVPQAATLIKVEADFPYLLWFQRALRANGPSSIPDFAIGGDGFDVRHLHDHSPVARIGQLKNVLCQIGTNAWSISLPMSPLPKIATMPVSDSSRLPRGIELLVCSPLSCGRLGHLSNPLDSLNRTREAMRMDFMKIIESLDEALYSVMSWLIFYPITLWRAVVRPQEMMEYADREVSDRPDEQYDDAVRPPLFLFLTLLLSHGLEVATAARNPLLSDTHGLAALVDSDLALLALRLLLFSLFPLMMAVRLLRRQRTRLTHSSLRRPFYAQCYTAAPFALGSGPIDVRGAI